MSVRKLAHYLLFASGGFVIYLILAIVFKVKHKILISIFLGMLLACADEYHQLYSLNRGPRMFDVIIDTTGVISGVIFASIINGIIRKIYKNFEKGKKIYEKLQKNNRGKDCQSS